MLSSSRRITDQANANLEQTLLLLHTRMRGQYLASFLITTLSLLQKLFAPFTSIDRMFTAKLLNYAPPDSADETIAERSIPWPSAPAFPLLKEHQTGSLIVAKQWRRGPASPNVMTRTQHQRQGLPNTQKEPYY